MNPTTLGRKMSAAGLPRLLALALAAAAATGISFGQATIEGVVALPQAHAPPVMNQRYEIVTEGGILSINPPLAVVYLDGVLPPPASRPTRQVAQKDFAFLPALLAVQAGTKVEFPNLDSTYHNIFSYSPAKRFDLGRYRPDERPIPSVVFDTAGLVVLRCDIHEHMRGLILVVDTPYFVVTDTAGRYRLTGLPAGRYTLRVWLDSRTTLARPVELQDGAALHADFP
jgi:plastocyanin